MRVLAIMEILAFAPSHKARGHFVGAWHSDTSLVHATRTSSVPLRSETNSGVLIGVSEQQNSLLCATSALY